MNAGIGTVVLIPELSSRNLLGGAMVFHRQHSIILNVSLCGLLGEI
jgi:hypothetical protein